MVSCVIAALILPGVKAVPVKFRVGGHSDFSVDWVNGYPVLETILLSSAVSD